MSPGEGQQQSRPTRIKEAEFHCPLRMWGAAQSGVRSDFAAACDRPADASNT
jgi:hypothetical protein